VRAAAGSLQASYVDQPVLTPLLAAVATATMPVLLAADHLAGPTAFDMLA
jgi:hypothetical protein